MTRLVACASLAAIRRNIRKLRMSSFAIRFFTNAAWGRAERGAP